MFSTGSGISAGASSGSGSISKGLFKSYTNASAGSQGIPQNGSHGANGYGMGNFVEEHEMGNEAQPPSLSIQPSLLRGETIVAHAQGVQLFEPLSSDTQGLIGEFYVTNFKISFQTIRFPEKRHENYQTIQDYWHPWMVGLVDIPLASICGLYRIAKNGRRKPFKTGALKRILIVTRNFRLEKFSFQQSSPHDSHHVSTALASYVFPQSKECIFLYSSAATTGKLSPEKPLPKSQQRNVGDFSTRSDWLRVLSRTASADTTTWRITQANENFHICSSLPKCFVIPASIDDDSRLESLCGQLTAVDERRPLVWCWSGQNGAALCRMSHDVPDNSIPSAVAERTANASSNKEGVGTTKLASFETGLTGRRKSQMAFAQIFFITEKAVKTASGKTATVPAVEFVTPAAQSGFLPEPGETPLRKFAEAVRASHPDKHPPLVLDISSLCPGVKDVKKHFDLWRDAVLADSAATDDKWLGEMENSRWLHDVHRCLDITRMIVERLKGGMSIILREDGDRDLNCLISSLTQLLMDPQCRTIVGFQTLIEKEFVALGHRFQTRMGLVKTEPDRESPVFLLFLDCVYQISQRHPGALAFTDAYLTLIYDTSLLAAFRNFTHMSQRDTFSPVLHPSPQINPLSVWHTDFLNPQPLSPSPYLNPLYVVAPLVKGLIGVDVGEEDVIVPVFKAFEMKVWGRCYFRFIGALIGNWSGDGGGKLDVVRGKCEELERLKREVEVLQGPPGVVRLRENTPRNFSDGNLTELEREGDTTDGQNALPRRRGGSSASTTSAAASSVSRRRSQMLRPSAAGAGFSLITFQKQ